MMINITQFTWKQPNNFFREISSEQPNLVENKRKHVFMSFPILFLMV